MGVKEIQPKQYTLGMVSSKSLSFIFHSTGKKQTIQVYLWVVFQKGDHYGHTSKQSIYTSREHRGGLHEALGIGGIVLGHYIV